MTGNLGIHCLSRAHCVACRTDRAFRETFVQQGLIPDADFECSHQVTASSAAQQVPQVGGVGTELTKLLSWMSEPTTACACKALAAKMDAMGPEWCDSHSGELADAILGNAQKLNKKWVTRSMIMLALSCAVIRWRLRSFLHEARPRPTNQ
jgi:hypothetical protein